MLQGISKGKCYVEMSTIDEETMQDVAEVILVWLIHTSSLYPNSIYTGGNNRQSKQSRKLNIHNISLMIQVFNYNVDMQFEC